MVNRKDYLIRMKAGTVFLVGLFTIGKIEFNLL